MLEQAFIIAFIVYFLKATTWRGMIFHRFKERLETLPFFIRMPLFECPVCMTPWWGIVVYLTAHYVGVNEFQELNLARLIFAVLTASGINTVVLIINKIYDDLPHERAENEADESNNKKLLFCIAISVSNKWKLLVNQSQGIRLFMQASLIRIQWEILERR